MSGKEMPDPPGIAAAQAIDSAPPEPTVRALQVTVAICTLNRADSLALTLESFTLLKLPPRLGWNLLVVDNGSGDHTPQVMGAFQQRLPLVLLNEPRRGLSHARNRAIAAMTGDYIIWTDDDVAVDPEWLMRYADAFRRHPEAAVFGGDIVPVLEEPVAPWLVDAFEVVNSAFAARSFGAAPVRFVPASDLLPFGANFAVRTAEQAQVRFDPDLGVAAGRTHRLAEETACIEQILRAGGVGYSVPGARVLHRIPRSRHTWDSVQRYFFALGSTQCHLDRLQGQESVSAARWFGVQRWMLKDLLKDTFFFSLLRFTRRPRVWMVYWRRIQIARAYIAEERSFRAG